MDFLVIAIVVGLFVGLTLYGVLKKPAPTFEEKTFNLPEDTAQHELFPWGKAWVYDNNRAGLLKGPPLVFIHGLGGSIYSWRHQIEAFAAERPLIAIDLLGFGRSDKPLNQSYGLDGHTQRILDILDAKKIETCYLVGCSLGGALSLWLSSQHPKRFLKSLLISPAAVSYVVPPLPALAYESLGLVGQKVISKHIIKVALRGGLTRHDKITPDIIETYLTPFREHGGMTCFFRTLETIKDPRIFANLNLIAQPTLILRGTGDRTINRRVLKKLTTADPRFEIIEHSHGGHHLMEDEPEWVNEKIRTFFTL